MFVHKHGQNWTKIANVEKYEEWRQRERERDRSTDRSGYRDRKAGREIERERERDTNTDRSGERERG